jgi:hypothetical protein
LSFRSPHVQDQKYDLQRDDIWPESGGSASAFWKARNFPTKTNFSPTRSNPSPGLPPPTSSPSSFSPPRWTPTPGAREDAPALLLEDSGRELHPNGKDPPRHASAESPMAPDNQTLVYMTNEDTPRDLYAMQYLNISSGPPGSV